MQTCKALPSSVSDYCNFRSHCKNKYRPHHEFLSRCSTSKYKAPNFCQKRNKGNEETHTAKEFKG